MSQPEIFEQISVAPTKTVILYDWMKVPDGRNLVLIDDGQVRWRAMPPMKEPGHDDCFVSALWDGTTLKAHTFSGFLTAVDVASGAVTILKFTK